MEIVEKMRHFRVETHHPQGRFRILVTKKLPGTRWMEILTDDDCRVEVGNLEETINADGLKAWIGDSCHGVIGQLTEDWNEEVLETLKAAGGQVYSSYAVGYDNVDIEAASRLGLPVGNTPGILTEATAEMAAALTFAAARRVIEGDQMVRAGRFSGWQPDLLLGTLLRGKTLGVVGAGRIGTAYARMMMQGCRMNLLYFGRHTNEDLERFYDEFNTFLTQRNEKPLTISFVADLDELLVHADIISIHTPLDESTHHLINRERFSLMKRHAVFINTSRGAVVDEQALVEHCRENPDFRAGLDVFEFEPRLVEGLDALPNVVLTPHLGSATRWTREGMAVLAACNVVGILKGWPVWHTDDMEPFLSSARPKAVPSIVNAGRLNLPRYTDMTSSA